ncbi:MAG TPA: ATP-grasp domain-containing protein [Burkholderiaceae bacterium]
MRGLTLLLPDKPDPERDAVADAWVAAGGKAERIGRFWEPPAYDAQTVRLYGNDTFCLVLAQKLGLELVSPPDDLLLLLPEVFVKRGLQVSTLADAATLAYPAFIKPLVPKLFKAAVYRELADLLAECKGLGGDTVFLISEIVVFESEVRAFVLQGRVLDVAVYEGRADLNDALAFANAVAKQGSLSPACVVDVGWIAGRGWAVIEANAAWGAGLNGCSAVSVLPAIAAASL